MARLANSVCFGHVSDQRRGRLPALEDDQGGNGANLIEGGLAIDSQGNIYSSGYTTSFGAGSADFVLVKFSISEPSDGIPGFTMFYLLIGLMATI